MSTREALYSLLEEAFNAWLHLDPEAPPKLAPLHSKVLHIRVVGIGLDMFVVPGPDGVHIYPELETPADCTISGSPLAMARLGRADRGQDELFAGRVKIDGDTDIGHRFGDILGQVDIDWTEQLATLVGDIPAQYAGDRVKSSADWLQQAGFTLQQDLAEYLKEEVRLCPNPLEVQEFYAGVDELRDAMARLEARVRRLQTTRDEAVK